MRCQKEHSLVVRQCLWVLWIKVLNVKNEEVGTELKTHHHKFLWQLTTTLLIHLIKLDSLHSKTPFPSLTMPQATIFALGAAGWGTSLTSRPRARKATFWACAFLSSWLPGDYWYVGLEVWSWWCFNRNLLNSVVIMTFTWFSEATYSWEHRCLRRYCILY